VTPEQRISMAEVDEGTVPIASRRAAVAALAFARRDLDLPPIRIRWFDVARPGDPVLFTEPWRTVPAGRCDVRDQGAAIWIRRGQGGRLPHAVVGWIVWDPRTPAEIAATVLHEAVHTRQALERGSGRIGASRDAMEAEAQAYAARNKRLTDAMGNPGWPQRKRHRAA
jgi:hypothetical protein